MLSFRSRRGRFSSGPASSVRSTSGYRTSELGVEVLGVGCDGEDAFVEGSEVTESEKSGIDEGGSGRSDVNPLVCSTYAGGGLHFSHCPSLECMAVMILSCIEVRYRSPSSHFSVTSSTLCPQARYCVCSK